MVSRETVGPHLFCLRLEAPSLCLGGVTLRVWPMMISQLPLRAVQAREDFQLPAGPWGRPGPTI